MAASPGWAKEEPGERLVHPGIWEAHRGVCHQGLAFGLFSAKAVFLDSVAQNKSFPHLHPMAFLHHL